MKNPAWRHYEFDGHEPPDHVAFIIRKRLAYVNWDTEQWDLIRDAKIAIPDHPHVCGLGRWSRGRVQLTTDGHKPYLEASKPRSEWRSTTRR